MRKGWLVCVVLALGSASRAADPPADGDLGHDGLDRRLHLDRGERGPRRPEECRAQALDVGLGRRVGVGAAGEVVDVDDGRPAVVLLDPRVEGRAAAGLESRRGRDRPAQVQGEALGVGSERDEVRGRQVRRERDGGGGVGAGLWAQVTPAAEQLGAHRGLGRHGRMS